MTGVGIVSNLLRIFASRYFKILAGKDPEIASLQKPTGQDAKPQRNLVEPGAMFGRKVGPMLMTWIAQEPPRPPRARRILKATEALRKIATSPTTNSMAVAVELSSSL
jgi:hypothetical protein